MVDGFHRPTDDHLDNVCIKRQSSGSASYSHFALNLVKMGLTS